LLKIVLKIGLENVIAKLKGSSSGEMSLRRINNSARFARFVLRLPKMEPLLSRFAFSEKRFWNRILNALLNGYPLLKFRVSSSYLRSSLNVTLVD
jgi:hypothetical protein